LTIGQWRLTGGYTLVVLCTTTPAQHTYIFPAQLRRLTNFWPTKPFVHNRPTTPPSSYAKGLWNHSIIEQYFDLLYITTQWIRKRLTDRQFVLDDAKSYWITWTKLTVCDVEMSYVTRVATWNDCMHIIAYYYAMNIQKKNKH
jgi:hypothetical protein